MPDLTPDTRVSFFQPNVASNTFEGGYTGGNYNVAASKNSARQVANHGAMTRINLICELLRTGFEFVETMISVYLSLKDYPAAQMALAYSMMQTEIKWPNTENEQKTMTYDVWATLYANARSSINEQDELNKRIDGYMMLAEDYEAQKRYADMMADAVARALRIPVVLGMLEEASGSGNYLISGIYVTTSGTSLSIGGMVGKRAVITYDPGSGDGTLLRPYVVQAALPGPSTIAPAVSTGPVVEEALMWQAAGANLDYTAVVAPDTHRKSDVSRRYGVETFSAKLATYANLGDDYLGKMQLAEKYKTEAGADASEAEVWDSLAADCAILLKLRSVRMSREVEA